MGSAVTSSPWNPQLWPRPMVIFTWMPLCQFWFKWIQSILTINRVPHFRQRHLSLYFEPRLKNYVWVDCPPPSKPASRSELVLILFVHPLPFLVLPAIPPWDFPDALEEDRDNPNPLGLKEEYPHTHQHHQALDLWSLLHTAARLIFPCCGLAPPLDFCVVSFPLPNIDLSVLRD